MRYFDKKSKELIDSLSAEDTHIGLKCSPMLAASVEEAVYMQALAKIFSLEKKKKAVRNWRAYVKANVQKEEEIEKLFPY